MNPFRLKTYCISEVGPVRKNNEDVFLEMPEHSFFAIADGMGGHNAGEVAANEAILNLSEAIERLPLFQPWSLQPLIAQIQKAVCDANTWVYELGKNHPPFFGMGTTLSCFLIHNESLLYAHVGDSRLYLLREGILTQLTEDHSLRAELLKKGELLPENAHSFPKKNIITKTIGTHKEVVPDIGTAPVKPGDLFFLCSDGLSDHLTDEQIRPIITSKNSIEEKAHTLIKTAILQGGRDNITIVMVEVE